MSDMAGLLFDYHLGRCKGRDENVAAVAGSRAAGSGMSAEESGSCKGRDPCCVYAVTDEGAQDRGK
eukprot:54850-Eustigmatos_ZCMA.PRE.1